MAARSFPRCGERRVRCARVFFERPDRADIMIGVAIGVAVGQSRSDLSQVVGADRPGAERARRLPAGRPAIHQDESHGMPPNAICVAGVANRQRDSSTGTACIDDSLRGLLASRSHISGRQPMSDGENRQQRSAVVLPAGLEAIDALL